MGKVKYSKKTTPPPISSAKASALRLKKSVCVILPRVDVGEFLRGRRSLTLSQGASTSNGSSPTVISSGAVRIKRRLRVKKEPPCIFHSQVDITDNAVTEEIPAALDASIQSDSVCIHDVTKSMCYMCSPHPTVEDKQDIWREINWHVPTPFVPNTSAQTIEPAITPASEPRIDTTFSQIQQNILNTTEIGVGTGNDLIAAVERRDQSTQTIRYFTCKHCLAMFTDVAHLIHHKAVHQKMFECPFCTANFLSKNDLKSHLKLHMLPKYYDCVYCNQAFTKKHDIRGHLALHAEEKQFRCQQCPARFPHKNNLTKHEESHNVSKFIHVFKKIDDSAVEPTISPIRKGRRSAEVAGTSTSVGSPLKSKSPRRSAGSNLNQKVAVTSMVPGTSSKPKPVRRMVSNIQRILPISKTIPSPSLVRPATSYLALSSIADSPRSLTTLNASTSAGPSTSSSFSVATNTEDTAPENNREDIRTNTSNFFQCPFCPLSCKLYRTFKAHSVCHVRKSGKFPCTLCGGRFTKKIGLFLHMKYSHTSA